MIYKKAYKEIEQLFEAKHADILQRVVEYLYSSFSKYSWIGIYFVEKDNLKLGPWKGEHATEHTIIPIGHGICGAAAKSGKTEIIDDVSQDRRYLACFISTRSEIVVPIWKGEMVIGEIDIDSNEPAAFSDEDRDFLENVAELISKYVFRV